MYNELELELIESSNKYYLGKDSGLTDLEWDQKYKKLKENKPDSEVVKMTGYGHKVPDGIPHEYDPIKGIPDEVLDGEPVPEFLNGIILPKLDGLSVTGYYQESIATKALTRGDGITGANVIQNVKNLIPLKVPNNFTGSIRCEGVLLWSDFNKHFPEGRSIRNSATGLVRADTPNEDLLKLVKIVPVSIYNADTKSYYYPGDYEFEILTKDFECKISHITGTSINVNKNSFEILSEDYPCDGLVVRYDVSELEKVFKFKFNAEKKFVPITKIESRTQPTGKIFPRLHYPPTRICGCTATHASGKSFEFIEKLGIVVGREVEIVRSGDVVPNLTGKLNENQPVQEYFKAGVDLYLNKNKKTVRVEPMKWMGMSCSYGCSTDYIEQNGANIYCTNPECPSLIESVIKRFIFRFAPKHFTEKMYEILREFYLNYSQKVKKLDLNIFLDLNTRIQGHYLEPEPFLFQEATSYQKEMCNIVVGILQNIKLSLSDIVHICAVEGFGETFANEIESNITNEFVIFENAFPEDLPTFWANSRARANWKKRYPIICQIMEYFDYKIPEKEIVTNESKGEVCITGTLSVKKKEFAKIIEDKGFTYSKDYNKNLEYLVMADPSKNSSKQKKAEKHGIKVISEQEFMSL